MVHYDHKVQRFYECRNRIPSVLVKPIAQFQGRSESFKEIFFLNTAVKYSKHGWFYLVVYQILGAKFFVSIN